MAELGQHVLGHAEGIGIVADVGPGENRAASHLRDVLRDVDGSRFAGDVIDGNVGALLGESECHGATDATGAARHEGGAPFELHDVSSCS